MYGNAVRRRGGPGGAEPPRGLGRDWAYDASPGKPCSVSGFLSLVAVAAVVEPQVPKAPAAPEADVPPDSYLPKPPVQHRQDLYG